MLFRKQEVVKVYKVVFRGEHGELRSILAYGDAEVVYTPNKWVEAPRWLAKEGYYLTAFKTIEDALDFVDGVSLRFEIWEAEAQGIIKKLPNPCDIDSLADRKLVPLKLEWPRGTIMCQRLRLIRRVK